MKRPTAIIVDYGIGNLRSIQKMAEIVGMRVDISSDPKIVASADRLILPGVGHFGRAIQGFRRAGLEAPLREAVQERATPILGLCVGAQMLLSWGEEGEEEGLGLIPGRVVRFSLPPSSALKLPNVGWRMIDVRRPHPLVAEAELLRFYFMHSYHALPDDPADIVATTDYGYVFPSIIARGSVTGMQFHPEKSHLYGKAVFSRFARLPLGRIA